MPKPSVFLSYSHKDEDWKNRLRTQLKVLEQLGTFVVWDDRRIDAGDTWYDAIRVAMDDAEVAVCLISADYLASDFCVKEEIPYLLKRRTEQGMRLLPVLLRPCPWKFVPWLKAIQMLPRDGKAVTVDFAATWDVAFDEVAEMIGGWLQEEGGEGGGEEALRSFGRVTGGAGGIFRSLPMAPPEVSRSDDDLPPPDFGPLARTSGNELFGRDAELNRLDELWEKGAVRVVSLTGPAGIGKSALVSAWLEGLRKRNPGAERTIRALDDPEDPPLAQLTRPVRGKRGFCIVISRQPLPALDNLPEGVVARMELGPLPPTAGRALLRVAGVRGTDAELEAISRDLGGLPLALVRRATAPSPPSA